MQQEVLAFLADDAMQNMILEADNGRQYQFFKIPYDAQTLRFHAVDLSDRDLFAEVEAYGAYSLVSKKAFALTDSMVSLTGFDQLVEYNFERHITRIVENAVLEKVNADPSCVPPSDLGRDRNSRDEYVQREVLKMFLNGDLPDDISVKRFNWYWRMPHDEATFWQHYIHSQEECIAALVDQAIAEEEDSLNADLQWNAAVKDALSNLYEDKSGVHNRIKAIMDCLPYDTFVDVQFMGINKPQMVRCYTDQLRLLKHGAPLPIRSVLAPKDTYTLGFLMHCDTFTADNVRCILFKKEVIYHYKDYLDEGSL